jgi:peptidoglycan-associated lipoprotein
MPVSGRDPGGQPGSSSGSAFEEPAPAAPARRSAPAAGSTTGRDRAATSTEESERLAAADNTVAAAGTRTPEPEVQAGAATNPTVSTESASPPPSAAIAGPRVVRFGQNQAVVPLRQKDLVNRVARILRANGSLRVVLRGHTDNIGSSAYNIALGERRARAVAALLQRAGVPQSRIEVESVGDQEPAVQGQRAHARALNRRVEIRYHATDGP